MNGDFQELEIDPELEVRLMNLVMGEASDFERDQLMQVMEQRPEVVAYYEHMQHLHGMMTEVGAGEFPWGDDPAVSGDDWKLSSERRNQVLEVISGQASKSEEKVELPKSLIASNWTRWTSVAVFAGTVCVLLGLVFLPSLQQQKMTATNFGNGRRDEWYRRDFQTAPASAKPGEPAFMAGVDNRWDESASTALEIREKGYRDYSSRLGAETNSPTPNYSQFGAPASEPGTSQGLTHLYSTIPPTTTFEDASSASDSSKFWSYQEPQYKSQANAEPKFVPSDSTEPVRGRSETLSTTSSSPPREDKSLAGAEPNRGTMLLGGVKRMVEGRDSSRVDEMMILGGEGRPGNAPEAKEEKAQIGAWSVQGTKHGGEAIPAELFDAESAGQATEGKSPSLPQGSSGSSRDWDRDGEVDGRVSGVQSSPAKRDADQDGELEQSKSSDALDALGDGSTRMMDVTPRIIIPEEVIEEDFVLGRGDAAIASKGREVQGMQEGGVELAQQGLSRSSGLANESRFDEKAKKDVDSVESSLKQNMPGAEKNRVSGEFESEEKPGSSRNLSLVLRADDQDNISLGTDVDGLQAGQATLNSDPSSAENSFESSWKKKSDSKTPYFRSPDLEQRAERRKKLTPSKPSEALEEISASVEAFSTFSLHVSDVSFKLAQAALGQGQWPEASKIRIEEFVNALDYHDALPSGGQKVACRVEQAIHPFLMQRNLLRISMRTAASGRAQAVPLRLTLLLDNSGSMERPDRRQVLLRAIETLTRQLQPADQVTLISFANTPRLLAEKIEGVQAQSLVKVIENLPSEGGTNIEAALLLAREKAIEHQLEGAQNRIVLLTDGAVNLGNANPESLGKIVTELRDEGIAFDAAGISAQDLNDEVLEALTRKGDGRYYLLDSLEAAEDTFAAQIAGALRPSAKNVKVQVEFNPQRVERYKLLGFEQHRLEREDFRNDQVDAAELAAEEAGVAVYQVEVKPNGQGEVGTVFVRFRDLETDQMIEQQWPILYESSAPRLDQANPSMQLAASAALFAAKLGGGPLAESVDLTALQKLLAALPESVLSQPRVQQLRTMIAQALAMN